MNFLSALFFCIACVNIELNNFCLLFLAMNFSFYFVIHSA